MNIGSGVRKAREAEDDDARAKRIQRNDEQHQKDIAAEDDRIDAMIKSNIELNGP